MDKTTNRASDAADQRMRLLELRLRQKGITTTQTRGIERRQEEGTCPLSYAQQRLWFLQQLQPESPAYLVSTAVRLRGVLQVQALDRSLQALVARHEILRVAFAIKAGQPLQVVRPTYMLRLPVIALTDATEADSEALMLQLARQERQQPCDLVRGPLLRVYLLRLRSQEHVMLITMHHIISDGWSMDIFFRELAVLYSAFTMAEAEGVMNRSVAEERNLLPPVTLQYGDFAVWQRRELTGEVLARQLDYWRQQLADVPALEFPTDRPRPRMRLYRGAVVTRQFPPQLSQQLLAFSQSEDVTLFILLLTALQCLLVRYTDQDDIAVGVPIANRGRPELEGMIGVFVNTLVMRAHLDGNPTFRAALRRSRETALNAYAHQDIPFEQLVEELQPERSLNRSPFFQIMFSIQQGPAAASPTETEGQTEDLTISRFDVQSGTCKFDLTIVVTSSSQGLSCGIEYDCELFDAATVERLIGHWQVLLAAIVRAPDTHLADLPLLTEAERRCILVDWNATHAVLEETGVHELFERQATLRADAVALVYEDLHLTYQQVNTLANQLAHYLQALGVEPESRIGIGLENAYLFVISLLAVLKTGGAYVPLDLNAPLERQVFVQQDTAMHIVLTQSHLQVLQPSADVQVIALDKVWGRIIEEQPRHNPGGESRGDRLAYVIYTSGSTGRPKGVCVSHRGIVRLVQHMTYAEVRPEDVLVQYSSKAFDALTFEVWGCLLYGAKVVMASQKLALEELGALLEKHQASILWITTGLFHQMVDYQLPAMKRIRQIITGGEIISPLHVQKMVQAQEEGWLMNMYGPTECTTYSSGHRLLAGSQLDLVTSVPIGRPISNTQFYVFDHSLNPVGMGMIGELYIGGAGLARGYLNRPELTAERFVPHPWSELPGERLYRTGDLVRYRSGGVVEFVGRSDDQIKLRGFRIELGEIEAVLSQAPEVEQCCVIVQTDEQGLKRLIAYVANGCATVDQQSLRAYLQHYLPDYMIPAFFVALEMLPLKAQGKIDRDALPIPDLSHERSDDTLMAARTPIEELVADVWRAVLGVEQVSMTDDFFEQGGHSLLATQLITRLRALVQVDLPLRSLFEASTVEGLAREVERLLRSASHMDIPPLAVGPRPVHLPLAFAQQRLWFLHQLDPNNIAYLIPGAQRLQGELDYHALDASLTALIQRHENLSAVFQMWGEQPIQVIQPASDYRVPVIDLHEVLPQERETVARSLARQETEQPCDLMHGPLLRVTLLRLSQQDHILLVTLHHIIADGWSLQVFYQELSELYQSQVTGVPASLSPLPIQYADFALWQRQWLQGEVLDTQLAYWRRQLADVPPLHMPIDHVRPARQTFNGDYRSLSLSRTLREQLVALSRSEGVTFFMLLLAAFQVLLGRHTQQDDICVGTPIANRTHPAIEGLIGFFVNTLALRTDLSGHPSFVELLQRVRTVALDAYTHQDVPFEHLVEALQVERDLSRTPLFQAAFSLQRSSVSLSGRTRSWLNTFDAGQTTVKFELMMNVLETDDGLYCTLGYNSDLFESTTIARLLEHWQCLLTGIAAAPQTRISALPLLTPLERQHLLVDWQGARLQEQGAQPVPRQQSLQQQLREQARRTPDALALMAEQGSLSYGALWSTAERLAQRLRQHGLRPQQPVALLSERSLLGAQGLLVVLIAGGVWLPLDVSWPSRRWQQVLSDSAAPLLLVSRALFSDAEQVAVQVNHGRSEGEYLQVVSLADLWQLAVCLPESEATCVAQGELSDLAYVLYTSGSTGEPKGVMVPQRAILNRLWWGIDASHLGAQDRVGQIASWGFDIALWELLGAWLVGGTCVLVEQAWVQDSRVLLRWLDEQAITVQHVVPSLLELLVQQGGAEACASLRQVQSGGERVPEDLLRRVQQQWGVEVEQFYGPTEAAISVTGWQGAREGTWQRLTLGRPIRGVQVYVLDPQGEPAPVGVVGEVYLGGECMSWGYWGRAAETAQRYVPDHLGEAGGQRLYRTGDLGRWRAEGELVFEGRADGQVKLRGHRVEPGEIEAVLREQVGVQACVVLAQERSQGEQELVAYVVAAGEEGQKQSEARLRAALQQRLPEYMVPSFFVLLDALPLTANGKIDRRALPDPRAQLVAQVDPSGLPRTPIEEVLLEIWQQLLQRNAISIYDDFFALGGHSLLVAQLTTRLQAALQIELSVRHLFASPTIAQLAQVIEQKLRAGQHVVVPPFTVGQRTQPPVLSFAQQRLWFLDQLEPDNSAYLIASARRIQGPLHVQALQASMTALQRRHESLRTTFPLVEGRPVQYIHAPDVQPLPLIDLRLLRESDRAAEARKLAEQEADQPCRLTQGPLWRTSLLRLAEQEHVLLLTLHHIISDDWSMQIVYREIADFYTATSAGTELSSSQLPVQYADFAHWQRQWLQDGMLEQQLGYWRTQLAGMSLLELPTDYPRPPVQTFHGAYQTVELPSSLAEALRALSRQQGVTLYMLLLAAFQVLLSRYSGQTDIAVGTPIANRGRPELEGIIGFFVNTLVMRTNLAGNPSFAEVLERVREGALDAYIHQDVPFESLVEALQPLRDLSRSPLFQVMFNLIQVPDVPEQLAGLALSTVETEQRSAKFDLTCFVMHSQQGLSCGIEYNTDLFSAATIVRLLDHWQVLLQGIVANPRATLAELPLLTDVERLTLLSDWNQTRQSSTSFTLHERFAAQVVRAQDSVALTYEDAHLTYACLNAEANAVARTLRRLGVGPEVRVGLCMQRSLALVIGVVGILKAGGAYVPLDPSYPIERLAFLRDDARIAALLVDQEYPDLFSSMPTALPTLRIGSDRISLVAEDEIDPDSAVVPENLAYIIYTSGSTGVPKGALVPHMNVARLFAMTDEWFHFHAGDSWTLFHSYAFDFSVWELWGALLYGGRLVVVPHWVSRSPDAFYHLLAAEQVTVLNQTPSAFRQLVQVEGLRAEQEELALRLVVFGGEALDMASLRPWFLRHGDQRPQLVNMYGITETTVHVTYKALSAAELPGEAKSVIGCAIPDLQLYVLDRHQQLVPTLVPGELYVGGPGLVRGYMRRPELTAERFVPHPFAGEAGTSPIEPGQRLYRTGDLVRYSANGELEYLGRVDQQIKIRGYRVELGEIESLLQLHPLVRACVVVVQKHTIDDERIIAYVVPEATSNLPGVMADAQERSELMRTLRETLKTALPEYMLPSAFLLLETLPLTENGKVDRRALLSLPIQQMEEAQSNSTSPIEELVAGVWSEVLGRGYTEINSQSNFFEQGGHSLLATQLILRLRAVVQREIPLRSLFETPTIAGLANQIELLLHDSQDGEMPALLPLPSYSDPQPLSFAQQRLWFLEQLQSENVAYLIPSAQHIHGPLDVAVLERCLRELVHRHASLRTTFLVVDDQPLQVIEAPGHCALPLIDISACSQEERLRVAQGLARQEAERAVDLTTGPLMRVYLVRLGATEHVLLLLMHHIISDGWSMQVFYRELTQLYQALSAGRPSPLPPPPIQYVDFALWQRRWLQGQVLENQLAYWRNQLDDIAPLKLPTDHPRPARLTFQGAMRSLEIPAALNQQLVALSRSENVTPFMLLLAAFQVLLARYTGQVDVSIGTPIANRQRAELEGVIGFFANTLVIRLNLAGNPSFVDLLKRVREVTLAAYTHQDIPFEFLVETLQPTRDLSRNPLFQVMFGVIQPVSTAEQELEGIQLSRLQVEDATTKFDLALNIFTTDQDWECVIQYSTDLFEAATIERMLRHWLHLLESIAATPQAPFSELSLLLEDERQQLLRDWQGMSALQPLEDSLQAQLRTRAMRTPNALAVVSEQGSLTYGAMQSLAERLAHVLRQRGVVMQAPVALLAERSLSGVLGLLGVLNAGGIWLLLDPSWPEQRLCQVLADSGATVLLTSRELFQQGQQVLELLGIMQPAAATRVRALCLADLYEEAQAVESIPAVDVGSLEDLAYVMYTSGSTGRPKGVMVSQRAIVNRLWWGVQSARLGTQDRVGQIASWGFDIALWELLGTWLAGGSCVLVPQQQVPDSRLLVQLLRRQAVTVQHIVPSLLAFVVQEAELRACRTLRIVQSGGEAVPEGLLRQLQEHCTVELEQFYGPTEAAISVTGWRGDKNGAWQRLTLGQPISNVRVYVLDGWGEPVPVGVIGELYLGGEGIGWGYWGQPSETSERFIPDGLSGGFGQRLYRTGDRGRWLATGELTFEGRVDEQVKIRGHRVEPREIEAFLLQHAGVQSCVVQAQGQPGDLRLAAYVVPKPYYDLVQVDAGDWQEEHVAQWHMLWDEMYRAKDTHTDLTFNIGGWGSSYTGEPIPDEAMREQIEQAVARIVQRQPQTVMEIGAGTGLLLFRIVPHCLHYYATDFSAEALSYVQYVLATQVPQYKDQVSLARAMAHEVELATPVDAVVLNSVAQYFPDVTYLLRVIENAIKIVKPGGFLFLGDIRSWPLLEAFCASVELFQAATTLSRDELRSRVQQHVANEKELLLDPHFFQALQQHLPRIGQVQVSLKRGHDHNELTRFRYDVVLQLDAVAEDDAEIKVLDWQHEQVSLSSVKQFIDTWEPGVLTLKRVPNGRLWREMRTLAWLAGAQEPETVGEFRALLEAETVTSPDPEQFWELGERLGYQVDISWSDEIGFYDVCLRRTAAPSQQVQPSNSASSWKEHDWQRYASNPLREQFARELVPQLRAYLTERLPDYMVPFHFVELEALPLTANGKVDRRALPDPQEQLVAQDDDPSGLPTTPIEEVLVNIWSDLLERPQVSIFDDFFDLGGHSLLATRLIARVNAMLGIEIAVAELFDASTVVDLAAKIEQVLSEQQDSVPPLAPVPHDQDLPLSFAQQRLWLVDQLEPGNLAYLMPNAWRLHGLLNMRALAYSLDMLVQRHEVLRTTFHTQGDLPVQLIHPAQSFRLPLVDLSGLTEGVRTNEARRLTEQEAQQPCDLARGPLLRVSVLRLGQRDAVLLLTLHHIITDGWSMQILLQELVLCYRAFVSGQRSFALPALPIQYADYAVWQRRWLQGETLAMHLAYWKKQLAGAKSLQLPSDRPEIVNPTYQGANYSFTLPRELLTSLQALGKQESVTLFMTLLAAFQTLLYRSSGKTDIVVGTDIANRREVETEALIGFFVNLLALRTDLSGAPLFRQVLQRVRRMVLEAFAHQDIPFEMLVEHLRLERQMSRTPLVRVLFVLQNLPETTEHLSDVVLTPFEHGVTTAKFDLALFMYEAPAGLSGSVVYSTDIFEERTIARMMDHFATLLRHVVAHPDTSIDALELYTETEKATLAKREEEVHSMESKSLRDSKEEAIDLVDTQLKLVKRMRKRQA